MNREKILFVVMLALTLLWGGLALSSPYAPKRTPSGNTVSRKVPDLVAHAPLPEAERLMTVLTGVPKLDPILDARGQPRAPLVPHSDLLPVEPAVLPVPRARPTPWIGLPVEPFPPVAYYARLREDTIPPIVTGAPEVEEEDDLAGGGAVEPSIDLPTVKDLLGGEEKWEFKAGDWDELVMGPGVKRYGRLSLTDASKKAGHTKYDLLLLENAEVEFAFEQLNIENGRMQVSFPKITLGSSGVKQINFADTIENRYWTRRTVDRIRARDEISLCDLGDWVLDLADEEQYHRMTGLSLAGKTYAEALLVKAGYLRAVLGRGETLHRQFRFDDELGLYADAQGDKEIPELLVRQARIHRKLGLDGLAVTALTRAIFHLPGDFRVRMLRGEAWLAAGDCEKALADFVQAGKIAGSEEKAVALAARGRALVRLGRPAEAESLLSAAEDAAGLMTLGAARYARMKWTEALDAFQKAADLDPENVTAMTNLGLARARTATDWEENSQSHLTQSVTHYKTAVEALPGNPYAHYILGRSYLRDGLYDAARKEFRTALFLDYHLTDALLGAGTANLLLGEWKNARALLERFVMVELRTLGEATDGSLRDIARRGAILGRYRLGRALIQSEDLPGEVSLEKAKEQFDEILVLDSTCVPAVNGLGYILFGLGDENGALDAFNKALQLAKAGSVEYEYAFVCLALIREQSGRRRWLETFDRPDSRKVGNRWVQAPTAGVDMAPRIRDGKVEISGRWDRDVPAVWLLHGDPNARGKTNRLNDKFIRVRAVVNVREKDLVSTRFIVFVRPARGADIVVGLGFERNARGEILIIRKKSGDKNKKKFVEYPLKDADGNLMMWPEGDVSLEIERIDPKKGVFEMFVNGASVGLVELGLKKGQGSLTVGFKLTGAAGNNFMTLIDEVEIELYER